jgi:hypothetical protein
MSLLQGAIELRDPAALYIAADLFLIDSIPQFFNPTRAFNDIRTAATLGYAPAIHKLAEITYLGLFGVGRSSSKGFKLFSQAAASGYRPSILRAATLLFNGDGVVANCPQAVSMLKRVVDVGPWTSFLDTYRKAGSRHAFTKMMGMNLTPRGWLDVHTRSEVTAQLLKVVGHEGDSQPASARMRRIRAAQEGDGAALLWLTLRSPLSEALDWLKRVELMPPAISMLATPLRWYLIARAIIGYHKFGARDTDAV